jgi:hypothetical protein
VDEGWSVYSTFLILQEIESEFGGQLSLCFAKTFANDQLSEYDPPSPTLSTPERTELPQHVQSSEMARYVSISRKQRKIADLVPLPSINPLHHALVL